MASTSYPASTIPSIAAYLPAKDKSTGAAVVIAPGGGHLELWMDHDAPTSRIG